MLPLFSCLYFSDFDKKRIKISLSLEIIFILVYNRNVEIEKRCRYGSNWI